MVSSGACSAEASASSSGAGDEGVLPSRCARQGTGLVMEVSAGATVRAMSLQPGDKAPAISLSDQSGKTVKLGDYKGRKVLVFFYSKADTPG